MGSSCFQEPLVQLGNTQYGWVVGVTESRSRICSGKVSERQSSFDGGLPFPAPGNVDHINRPKSMMMLMLLMTRLVIEIGNSN